MDNVIPNTDNREVAIIAAALFLSGPDALDETLEARLDRFVKAYDVVRQTVCAGADEGRVRLQNLGNIR